MRDVPRRGVAPLRRQADRPPPARRPRCRGTTQPRTSAETAGEVARQGTRPKPGGYRDNGRPTTGHANGSITPRQLDAVWKVGQAKGLDPNAVEHMSLRVFNRKPDDLTHEEGAALIKELSNLKRRVA